MNTATERQPSIAQEQPATLFVALELSKATWLVALHTPERDRISQHRLTGGDQEGLLALIRKAQTRAEAELGRPVRVVSCYEAGYDGFWLHRLLCDSNSHFGLLGRVGAMQRSRASLQSGQFPRPTRAAFTSKMPK